MLRHYKYPCRCKSSVFISTRSISVKITMLAQGSPRASAVGGIAAALNKCTGLVEFNKPDWCGILSGEVLQLGIARCIRDAYPVRERCRIGLPRRRNTEAKVRSVRDGNSDVNQPIVARCCKALTHPKKELQANDFSRW